MAILWLTGADTIQPAGPFTAAAVENASYLLYTLSGRKYGGIRSTTESYTSNFATSLVLRPQVISGNVFNLPVNTPAMRNLYLRETPVHSIASITQSGVTFDPATYSLRNNRYVVRANGIPWALDPINELVVQYSYGLNPPESGKRAAIRLANEFILLYSGSPDCSLPERIQSVTRQGISYTLVDPQDFLREGKIGIPEIDLFLASTNPSGAKNKAKIFSVDRPRGEKIN